MTKTTSWKLAERERWQPVEPFLDKVGVGHGMIVADIGSGDGYFTLPIARVLRGSGTVFALDTSAERLEALGDRLSRESLTGWVVPVLSTEESLALPEGSVDLAVMVNVLHATSKPVALLKEVVRVLRSQGTLVVVDWAPLDDDGLLPELGPAARARLPLHRAREIASEAGLGHVEELDLYKLHYTLVLRRPAVVGRRSQDNGEG